MTDTLEIPTRQIITRRVAATLEVGDGRTVVGLCAPFGVTATVSDGGTPFLERIVRGAFRRAVKAPNRVTLNREHRETMGDEMGFGVAFEEHDDGLVGTFRVYDGPLGDHALGILRSGSSTGLSISAGLFPNGTRIVDGVVERTILELRHVALTSSPAYEDAKVLALRSAPEQAATEAVVARNAALRARFNR